MVERVVQCYDAGDGIDLEVRVLVLERVRDRPRFGVGLSLRLHQHLNTNENEPHSSPPPTPTPRPNNSPVLSVVLSKSSRLAAVDRVWSVNCGTGLQLGKANGMGPSADAVLHTARATSMTTWHDMMVRERESRDELSLDLSPFSKFVGLMILGADKWTFRFFERNYDHPVEIANSN